MATENDLQHVKTVLWEHKQGHLLSFWDQLDSQGKEFLFSQIRELDMSQIDHWVSNLVNSTPPSSVPKDFRAARSYSPEPEDSQQRIKYDRAHQLGIELISSGKVAAFVVAGGQGTRLGFDGPKGNLPISPLRNKTLFRLFAEAIAAVSEKYNAACPWYVMTSPLNHRQTIEIFDSNDYYGLDKRDVFIFQQGTFPNFGLDGRILLANKGTIACSPDGHGGSLRALYKSGALADMKERGIEHISYFQVDNPLVSVIDPLFIGLHALGEAQMSSKALIKTAPKEKVGNFCMSGGKVMVIEYSDLPDELAEKRNPDGSLVFQLGSIAIHIIDRVFVEKLNNGGFALPLHRALKKISYIDADGTLKEPDEPNGIKLESFVFDALEFAEKSIILQTRREEEFGPVKNATGIDSAQTARKMMINRAANWLEEAGINVPRKDDGSADCVLEIASGFALEADDVKTKADEIEPPAPGGELYLG